MKTSDWIKEQKPVFTWDVPSKSKPGTFHNVSWFKDEHWECDKDCIGFQMSKKKPKTCKHIRILKNRLNGMNYGQNYKPQLNKARQKSQV